MAVAAPTAPAASQIAQGAPAVVGPLPVTGGTTSGPAPPNGVGVAGGGGGTVGGTVGGTRVAVAVGSSVGVGVERRLLLLDVGGAHAGHLVLGRKCGAEFFNVRSSSLWCRREPSTSRYSISTLSVPTPMTLRSSTASAPHSSSSPRVKDDPLVAAVSSPRAIATDKRRPVAGSVIGSVADRLVRNQ